MKAPCVQVSFLIQSSYTLVTSIRKRLTWWEWGLPMLGSMPSFVWFCFLVCLFCFFYLYSVLCQTSCSSFPVSNWFLLLVYLPRIFCSPKRKASGVLLAGNPRRKTNKHDCKGYRDWFDDEYLTVALALEFQRPMRKVLLMELGALE